MDPISGGVGAGILAIGIGCGALLRSPSPLARGIASTQVTAHMRRLDELEERVSRQTDLANELESSVRLFEESSKAFQEAVPVLSQNIAVVPTLRAQVEALSKGMDSLTPRVDALAQIAQVLPGVARDVEEVKRVLLSVSTRTTRLEQALIAAQDREALEPTPAIADPWSDSRIAALRNAAQQMANYSDGRRREAESQFAVPAPAIMPADVQPFLPNGANQ